MKQRSRRARGRPPARKGESVEGRVRGLAHGGEAVVETESGLVFAPFALPGERVRLVGLHRTGAILRGRVDAILDPSSDRVTPPCALLDRCGGCLLMPLSLAAQREHKRSLLQTALARVAPRSGIELAIEAEGTGLGYRRRARLHWEEASGEKRVGYRGHRSRDTIDVETCPVLAPPLSDALAAFRSTLLPHLVGAGELWLALGAGGRAVLAARSDVVQPPEAYLAAESLAGREILAGVALRAGGATVDATWGDAREWIEGVDGAPLVSGVMGFSQANDAVSRMLVRRALEWADAGGQTVLELYAGHGNFTVGLARTAAEVVAVELDPGAVEACRANLAARGLSATVIAGDAAHATRLRRADVVLLDPPRQGAREVLPDIARLRPRRIVYVSCDPATLERDLRVFAELGYEPDRAAAFDMFPHTAHVEALVRLVPRLAPDASER